MRTIYKYPVALVPEQVIALPRGYRILSVQNQDDRLRLWAMVETDERPTVPVLIRIIGTGHPVPDAVGVYLATVQTDGGMFVWHVFTGGGGA